MNVSNVNVDLQCAHQLSMIGLPANHPCSRLHGHTYRVSVEFSYSNNPRKLLVDFGDVKRLIRDRYDHRNLNDVMSMPPTAENLSKEICELLEKTFTDGVTIRHVTVAETDTNITTYIPEDEADINIEEEN